MTGAAAQPAVPVMRWQPHRHGQGEIPVHVTLPAPPWARADDIRALGKPRAAATEPAPAPTEAASAQRRVLAALAINPMPRALILKLTGLGPRVADSAISKLQRRDLIGRELIINQEGRKGLWHLTAAGRTALSEGTDDVLL